MASLNDLYGQWRALTDAEGDAIRAGDWSAVKNVQSRKEILKRELLAAADVWHAEWSKPDEGKREYERVFRPVISELIALEQRNHAWLCEQRARAQAEINELDASSRNLRGINRAYSSGTRSCWQTYS